MVIRTAAQAQYLSTEESPEMYSLSPTETEKGETFYPEQSIAGEEDPINTTEFRYDLEMLVDFLQSPEASHAKLGKFFDEKFKEYLFKHPVLVKTLDIKQLQQIFGKNYREPLLAAAKEILHQLTEPTYKESEAQI